MRRHGVPVLRKPVIVNPLTEPGFEVTTYTSKIFPLILTHMRERFAFVYEQASFFYRVLRDKKAEKVPKRKGTGFAGGGSKPGETPLDTAIREGNEELGVKIETLQRLIRPDICYTVNAGDGHPFHLFCVPVTEKEFDKGFLNRAHITDWKLTGRKAGWARLRALDESILAPENKEERERREERGSSWFYYSHQILTVAMLIKLVKVGEIKGKQTDLPRIVFQQISPIQGFSQRMVEMLIREVREDLLEERLPRLAHSESLSRLAARALVACRQDALVERLIEQADRKWREELEDRVARMYQTRDSRETPHVFGSIEEMMAAHFGEPEEETDENAIALADPETPRPVYDSMEDMISAISFDEEEN